MTAFLPATRKTSPLWALNLTGILLLGACGNGLDWDMRSGGVNTRDAALGSPPAAPPRGDANGLINYSGYQAVQASGNESVGDIAARLGLNGAELARFNALQVTDRPRMGEVLVLPSTVAAAAPAGFDVSAVATSALDRVQTTTLAPAAASLPPATAEPSRHKVQRGETAFGIARQYGVTSKALAQWNGLGPDLGVREGQYLIIPVAGAAPPVLDAAVPGAGSKTPVPPSASQPLPDEKTVPAATAKANAAKPAADLSGNVSAASATALAMPVSGKIIRGYAKGKNDGIDISAAAGTAVKAAADGTVAAVTKSTAGTPIVLIRHANGILTVYGGVDGLKVAKGDAVKRGQTFATVGKGDPSFLHFEVRKGVESVDPMGYLQ
jgi:murein DD-endopeptidase MepM/ murein hydrolase activator NlpD